MSITNENIPNGNFLSPLGFRLTLKRAPHVQYFCQAAELPTMSMTAAPHGTPFVQIPRPGDKITFEPLTVQFIVDENMENYLEMYNWIVGLGHPEKLQQYRDLIGTWNGRQDFTKDSIVSDATLLILTSNHNGNIRINFEDMFPVSLSPLRFETTQADVEYLTCECSFNYKIFTVGDL